MSPANLNDPFGPSCCEAGGESGYESARPCGCDPGAKWICQRHQTEMAIAVARRIDKDIEEKIFNESTDRSK